MLALRAMEKTKAYAAVLEDEDVVAGDIDMDRVVADPHYRRQLIVRLRRERLEIRSRRDAPETAADEDD
jgi:hypothetical protein